MRSRSLVAVLAVACCLTVAACGSQLDPDTVARVNGTTGLDSGGGAVGADGSLADGSDAGAAAGSGTTGSDGGSGTGSGDSSSGGGGGDSGDGTQGTGANSATGTAKAGSCAGFKNQTGITDDTVTLANASDLSGPVPGIFESAQQGLRAYVAYFNSTSDLCGRKLAVEGLDSRTDAGGDQQAYAKACEDAFAAVGSMSAFDSGGAATAQQCGLPDLRSTTTTPERRDCTTCFATQSVDPDLVGSAMPRYFLKTQKEATQHAALLFINAGAASVNADRMRNGWAKAGWKVDYFQGIDVSEFNYAPYVQQLKDKGIELVAYVGPYQNTEKLLAAMKQQGYQPKVFVQDATIYDQRFTDEAGSEAKGVYVYSSTKLFDDYSVKEMQLYRSWLDQVKPGAIPNYYGLYAWSAARLFVQEAVALGGKLTRASLVSALKGVKNWTGNGLHVPQQVGAKTTSSCASIIQYDGSKWRQVSPGGFMCGPLLDGS